MTRPLRILSFTNTPADPSSGSGYVILGWARELRRRGHTVEIFDPSEIELLPGLGRARQYKQALGMAIHAPREARRGSPDVVELWGGEAWLAALRFRRMRSRRFLVVARSNGLETHCALHFEAARRAGELARTPWYQLDQTRLFERTFRTVDALVTVSEYDREFALEQRYLDPSKILALPNPLPSHYLGRPIPAPSRRERVIGFCGSWTPQKGSGQMREALPTVLREFPDWRLRMVGVGPGFDKSGQFPSDVLDRIEIVPHADRESELVPMYESMAVLVTPSIYESFRLVAAEAMACATPVLGPRTGLLASLEADRDFLLLPDRKPESLVQALRRAILDPDLRAAVGTRGRQVAQGLRWGRKGDRLESAYQQWLREHRGLENPPNHP